jgi:hypothetical protein
MLMGWFCLCFSCFVEVFVVVLRWLCYGLLSCLGFDIVLLNARAPTDALARNVHARLTCTSRARATCMPDV